VQNAFDPAQNLVAGEQCADGSGEASIVLLHWDFDFEALSEYGPSPEVITSDFGQVKFDHDREVYVFAYVGENTDFDDIPIPPEDRFDTLNGVSATIEFQPESLVPRDSGVDLNDDGTATDDGDGAGTLFDNSGDDAGDGAAVEIEEGDG